MTPFTIAFLLCSTIFGPTPNTPKEKAVTAYYTGFEQHDWKMLENLFAEGFTFSAPSDSEHLTLDKFKSQCWPTNKYFKKANLIKMNESGKDLFLLVEISTTDGKIVRNVDLYKFNAEGKIQSIEVFFGPGPGYPGSGK